MTDDLERQALIVWRDAEKLMKRWMDGLEKSNPFVGRYSSGQLDKISQAINSRVADVINQLWYEFDYTEERLDFEVAKFKMLLRLMREGARPGDDLFVPEVPTPVFAPREKSESPIEQAMFKGLRSFGWLCADPAKITEDYQQDPLKRGVYIYQQASVLGYRADFLLGAMASAEAVPHWVVVECDGHEFHERTPEQAEHDRARDRAMTAAGYHVFRFTGREIRRDAARCADEVLRYLRPFLGGGDA